MSDENKLPTPPTALAVRSEQAVQDARDFMPLLTVEEAIERKQKLNAYIKGIMHEGDDFGKMPGDKRDDAKKVLLKPGAEKLCSVFGLTPQYVKETIIEDWTGKDHGGEALFYYEYRCQLWRGPRFMGEAIGSANSWEVKYRYRWVNESQLPGYVGADGLHLLPQRGGSARKFEPDFAIAKRETTGQYGKPAEYWDKFTAAAGAKRVIGRELGKRTYDGWEITLDSVQYRIPNPDVAEIVNTLQKMAQKRALVAAVLVVTNASDSFTQDLEDFTDQPHGPNADSDQIVDDEKKPDAKKEPAPDPADQREGIDVPPAIAKLLKEWEAAGKKPLIEGLTWAKAKLIHVLPQNGEDEYKRTLEKAGVKAKGGNSNGVLLKAILMVSALADAFQANALKTASQPASHATVDTLSTAVYESWADAPDAMARPVGTRIVVKGETFEVFDDKGNLTYRKVEQ